MYVSKDMSVTSDECISLSMSSISSSTMSCSAHLLFAPIIMSCVWKEQNCVTHMRLRIYVPNLLGSLMNCYVLPDLHTVLLLKVRSITEWKIGYRVLMACIQRVYTEFIVIAASGVLFRMCNQMLCVNSVKGMKCGNIKDIYSLSYIL